MSTCWAYFPGILDAFGSLCLLDHVSPHRTDWVTAYSDPRRGHKTGFPGGSLGAEKGTPSAQQLTAQGELGKAPLLTSLSIRLSQGLVTCRLFLFSRQRTSCVPPWLQPHLPLPTPSLGLPSCWNVGTPVFHRPHW